MLLTKENLQEWKAQVDKLANKHFGYENFSATLTDTEWTEQYEGQPALDAIQDEHEALAD